MFSAFTPFGLLGFSSQVPRAEAIYNALAEASGGNFENTFEGPVCADWYATAMAVAGAREALERAENQADPETVHEMLPVQESMYGLSVGPSDTANTRRSTLAARYKVALPPTRTNVARALQLLLGEDFRAWVPNPIASPSSADPPGGCKPATARLKLMRLLLPVLYTGTPLDVRYQVLRADGGPLAPGETLVIDPGQLGIEETVTVLAGGAERRAANGTLCGAFQAVFTHAHEGGTLSDEVGARCFAGPFPSWTSYKKNSLVVVKSGRAADPVLRARVDDVLMRMISGTSTWDIVNETSLGHAGPFRVGVPGIGTAALGDITYVSL